MIALLALSLNAQAGLVRTSDHTTLQEALDATEDGDVVVLDSEPEGCGVVETRIRMIGTRSGLIADCTRQALQMTSSANGSRFYNVAVEGADIGLNGINGVDNVIVSGFSCMDCGTGVRVREGENWWIHRADILTDGTGPNDGGVVLNAGTSRVRVTFSRLEGSAPGVRLYNGAPSPDPIEDVALIGNRIASDDYAVLVRSRKSTASMDRISIWRNRTSDSAGDVRVDAGSVSLRRGSASVDRGTNPSDQGSVSNLFVR